MAESVNNCYDTGPRAPRCLHITLCGPLAQLAEQQTLNLRVWGSSPRRLTIFLDHNGDVGGGFRSYPDTPVPRRCSVARSKPLDGTMSTFRRVFKNIHTVLPVIHVESQTQALRNALVARDCGCDGVFVMHHGRPSARLLEISRRCAPRILTGGLVWTAWTCGPRTRLVPCRQRSGGSRSTMPAWMNGLGSSTRAARYQALMTCRRVLPPSGRMGRANARLFVRSFSPSESAVHVPVARRWSASLRRASFGFPRE